MASVTVSTNSVGRASAQIRLLSQPGLARFLVTVPALELTDTFQFTINPGNGVQLYIQPRDSAVYKGGSFGVSAAVLDQWGNPRADPITLTTPDPAIVEVSPDGRLTGLAYGQARIVATGGGFTDATKVSVLPAGTIAVGLYAVPSNVAVSGLDGSGFRTIVETGVYGGGAPSWSPDGSLLAYHYAGSAGSPSLWVTDLAGNARKLISQHPGSFSEEGFPRFSRDGVWIYFQGITFTVNPGEIWRIHPDGTGLEMVGQPGSSTGADYYPDPSPDGTKVVFATTRGQQGFRIRVRTLATGVEDDLGVSGLVPRWSPAGDWIAYHGNPDVGDGGIYLIRPDGTEAHSIADGRSYDLESVEWSPDAAWVLGRTAGGLELVGVNDTLSLPIPSSTYWMFPSWLR
jgi:hypothetical protein